MDMTVDLMNYCCKLGFTAVNKSTMINGWKMDGNGWKWLGKEGALA